MVSQPNRIVSGLRGLLLAGLVVAFVSACGSGPTPTPIVVVVTNTFAPEPEGVIGTATLTPIPQEPSSATPQPAKPSPTATAPARSGPFRQVTPGQGLLEGEVNDIWIDPDGAIWVAGDHGVFRSTGDGWTRLLATPSRRIQGADAQGRVWVIEEGETGISAHDPSGSWTHYGLQQGWTVPPVIEYLSPGYGDGLATDGQGRIWLATGRDDLRSFDPASQAWTVLYATQLGFDPPEDEGYQGHFVADVASTADGQVWVGDCMGMGESYRGQGVRRSTGQQWVGEPATAGECVLDLEVDAAGRVYAGAFDALLIYDPDLGAWSRVSLPAWDRRQLVNDITLDAAGNPWVEIIRYGGASAWGAVARYHLVAGKWTQDFDGWLSDLDIGDDGVPWLCSEGAVYKLQDGAPELVDTIGGNDCRVAVDGQGVVWVASHTGLWRLAP